MIMDLMNDLNEDKITLTPFLRDLLLKDICRRIDIIDYCSFWFHLTFKKSVKNIYTSDCPYCPAKETFTINRVTGKSSCRACKKEEDFITLVKTKEGVNLNSTLHRLSGYLEGTEKRKQEEGRGAV